MSDECGDCDGARLVGWSGAGPILCPRCSAGEDAFTVITQAWREQRTLALSLARENAILRSRVDEADSRTHYERWAAAGWEVVWRNDAEIKGYVVTRAGVYGGVTLPTVEAVDRWIEEHR